MTRPLIIRPEAEADLAGAAAYYAKVGHARGFEERIDGVLEQIGATPLRFPVLYEDVRRALVRRHPYAILYIVEPTRTVVLAVLHQRRDPVNWPRR